MKVLLIGGEGQLGSSLIPILNKKHQVYHPGRQDLNLTNFTQLGLVLTQIRPDFVVNCAAFHDVPLCEIKYSDAFMTNAFAVRELAKICGLIESNLVTFSTDYVFDGSKEEPYVESDYPRPIQVYGSSKYQGELFFQMDNLCSGYIVRTSSLYGSKGSNSKNGNFVLNRIKDWKNLKLKKIEISSELSMSPTFTGDLAIAVSQLVEMGKIQDRKILHLSCEGAASWAEFAQGIYDLGGMDVEVVGVDRKGMTAEMRRPINSVLKNTIAKKEGIFLPHWKDSLGRYLDELKQLGFL